jgi:hypothetical protein
MTSSRDGNDNSKFSKGNIKEDKETGNVVKNKWVIWQVYI